jgi:hypothetical protein
LLKAFYAGKRREYGEQLAGGLGRIVEQVYRIMEALLVKFCLPGSRGHLQPGSGPVAVGKLCGLREVLLLLSEGLVKVEAGARQASWECWVMEACSGGAARAFRFVNRLATGDLEQAKTAASTGSAAGGPADGNGGDLSSDLRVIARAHSENWGRIWKDERYGDRVEAPVWDEAMELPAALDGGLLCRASAAFSAATSAVDGIHPRQVRLLSKELLRCLCLLFRAYESLGAWPATLANLIVRLLPKDTGGFRTIGLFRTLFRVWAKARATLLAEWAVVHLSHPMWNNFSGRRPGDVVWRELVRASHEGTLGRTAAAIQVDVSKMFDRICHALLVMAAKWSAFPLWLLRAALASYMWMRVLVLPEGVAGEPIWPRGGVVPGSAFAVFEVAMFLLASLLGFYRTWAEDEALQARFLLSIQVDDFNITVMADRRATVRDILVNAAFDLAEILEDKLGLPIGRDKTLVSASDPVLGKQLAHDLADLGARCEGAPRRLGLRFALAPGGSRDRKLQRARLGKFAKKMGRLTVLAKVKKVPARTFGRIHSALLAGPLYGAEVCPLEVGVLRKLRRQAADFRRLGAKSGSQDLLWSVQTKGSDPECRHWWLVLERYCREVYLCASWAHRPGDVLELPVLRAEMQRTLDAGNGLIPSSWFHRLPLHGAVTAVLRAGWVFRGPFRLVTLSGHELDLMFASPAMVRQRYYRDYGQHGANEYMRGKAGEGLAVPCELDLVAVRRVLESKGARRLSASERACLTCAFTGGLLTRHRLHAWGLAPASECTWCGKPDTLQHRIFDGDCGDDELKQTRQELGLGRLLAAAGGSPEGHNPLWLERLAVPEQHGPESGLTLVAMTGQGVEQRAIEKGAYFDPAEGDPKLFMDGSCRAPLTCYARAAGALLQFKADGTLLRGLTFVVPAGWPQTAAAAEHLAYIVAHDHSMQGMIAVTDCGSVFRSAAEGLAYATNPKRPWAAAWADVRAGWMQPPVKVKAHFTKQQCEAIGQGHLWAGNQAVDLAAKQRAGLALPPEGVCSVIDVQEQARALFYCGVARVLAAYPPPSALVDPLRRKAVGKLAASQLVLYRGHELACVPQSGRWVCLGCSASCSSPKRTDLLAGECPSNNSAVAQCMAGARAGGHVPWVAFLEGTRVPLVCCVRCGSFSEACSNVIGLRRECLHRTAGPKRSEPSKGAKYRLGRFLKGKHPTKEYLLEGPYSTLPSELVWRPAAASRPGEGSVCGGHWVEADCLEGDGWLSPPEDEEFEAEHASVPDPWPEGPPDWPEEVPP